MISRSRAPWREIMSQLYDFQAEIISPKQQFGSTPPPSPSFISHMSYHSTFSVCIQGRIQNFFNGGLNFFFLSMGVRDSAPYRPENPLKTIDFICPGGLIPNSHPPLFAFMYKSTLHMCIVHVNLTFGIKL